MEAFTNIDIKITRKKLGMTASELAEKIGREPHDVYNYESGKCLPDMDTMMRIAFAFKDPKLWDRWMRTYNSSYARLIPGNNGHGLQGAIMEMGPALNDVLELLDTLLRDASDGAIKDAELRENAREKTWVAAGVLINFLLETTIPTTNPTNASTPTNKTA